VRDAGRSAQDTPRERSAQGGVQGRRPRCRPRGGFAQEAKKNSGRVRSTADRWAVGGTRARAPHLCVTSTPSMSRNRTFMPPERRRVRL